MDIRVIKNTKDSITGNFISEGTIITRVNDFGKDMYSGVMGEFGVLVPMDDCAIYLEDLHG
jgi:hypothetical protein